MKIYYNAHEIADIFGISYAFVKKLEYEGHFVGHKLGRKSLYEPEVIDIIKSLVIQTPQERKSKSSQGHTSGQ